MNYAKQIKQEKRMVRTRLEDCKDQRVFSSFTGLFAMSYVDSMKRLKDYKKQS